MLPQSINDELSAFFKRSVGNKNILQIGGGSINQTFQIKFSDNEIFFCKANSATKFPHLFEKERNGLALLSSYLIRTPRFIFYSVNNDYQLLLLEWIRTGTRTRKFWTSFGMQLAALHKTSNSSFGLAENNYMGSVVQINTATSDWSSFFVQHRLKPLIDQCLLAKLLPKEDVHYFERVFAKLPAIFTTEPPALVHGDLWSGNFMCNEHEEPVLIDPAVYFGHRSMDLAMTTLFGGFDKAFYEAYHYHYPLPGNYKEQWEVCNLYPLLIHLLLFGKSYLAQIETTLRKYQ